MKPIMFKNRMNNDKFICEDTRRVEIIDGVEYIYVHKINEQRSYLMRKEALERVKEKFKQ